MDSIANTPLAETARNGLRTRRRGHRQAEPQGCLHFVRLRGSASTRNRDGRVREDIHRSPPVSPFLLPAGFADGKREASRDPRRPGRRGLGRGRATVRSPKRSPHSKKAGCSKEVKMMEGLENARLVGGKIKGGS